MSIFLHSDDINLLTYWENSLTQKCNIIEDLEDVLNLQKSTLIINYSSFDGKEKEIINSLQNKNNNVLVLHRTPNIQTAKEMLSYGAKAYGNALMKAHFLHSALESVHEGMVWLHPEFTSQLIMQIDVKEDKDISSYLEQLSEREKEVALLLRDSKTYNVIATSLQITPRTVKAHAHSIYKKLHVKDRLALALLLK